MSLTESREWLTNVTVTSLGSQNKLAVVHAWKEAREF